MSAFFFTQFLCRSITLSIRFWSKSDELLRRGTALGRLADAVRRRRGFGEFVQSELLELGAREARADFPARGALGFQLLPKALIGVELVHQSLGRALFRRQVGVWIHGAVNDRGIGFGQVGIARSQWILISFSSALNSGSPVTSSVFRSFARAAAKASARLIL